LKEVCRISSILSML